MNATTKLAAVAKWAKSKAVWFFGLLLRLGLVALVTAWVAVEAVGHSQGRGWLVPLLFPLVTGFAGVTWAVHHRLPFFRARSEAQRWLIAAAGSLLVVVVVVPGLWLAIWVGGMIMDSTTWARLASPTNNGDEMRFYEYPGFIDEDMAICAKPAGQREQLIFHFVSFGYGFSSTRWSRDGRVAACEMNYAPDDKAANPIQHAWVIAYDFSTGQALAPAWLDIGKFNHLGRGERTANWPEAEARVLALVAAHGGWAETPAAALNLHHLWFWQTPEYQKS